MESMRLDAKAKPRWWHQPSRRDDMMIYLRELRERPGLPHTAQQGLTARQYGLTDWYVQDRRSGRWLTLGEVKASLGPGERLLDIVDYGEGLETLTELGRNTLAEWEQDARKAD